MEQPEAIEMTRAERVIAFIETLCKVPEGKLVGQPIKLLPFQKKFIHDVYDNPAVTRHAYLSIARKNGKTALIACLLLAHICGPEAVYNSQIVSGAMSRKQAALVFDLASKIIRMNPLLMNATHIQPYHKRIMGLARNVEYTALSAEAKTAHGLSPVLGILDEIGQVRGPSSPFVDAITTSQGAHDNPLIIAISTSSPSDADMFSIWIDDAKMSGDPKIVCHEYIADKDCDLMDRSQWMKANPALGVFRSESDLLEQLSGARRVPSKEAASRNLLLNQRIALERLWLAPSVWKENGGAPDIDLFRSSRVALGLDLSSRADLTAAVLAAMDDDGLVHLIPYVFAPTSGLEAKAMRDKAPYADWVRDGFMHGVPGHVVDYEWVADFLRDEFEKEGIIISEVHFDRWRIEVFKKAAVGVGFALDATWVPVGQGYKDMSPRVEEFETMLLKNKVRHGNHPLLNMSASNAILATDPSGNRKPEKSKSTQRIDPIVAALMASYAVTSTAFVEFDVAAIVG